MTENETPIAQIDSQISQIEGRLEAAGISTSAPPPDKSDKPNLFDGSAASDAKLRSELGAIYDRSEKESAAADRTTMPENATDATLRDTASRAYDWANMSKAEQRTQVREAEGDKDLREEAERRGLSINELTAIKAAEASQQAAKSADQFAEAAAEINRLYPGQPAHQIARGYAQLENRIRQNPVAGLAEIATALGYDPRQVAAAMLGQQPSQEQVQAFQEEQSLNSEVQQFLKNNPDANDLRFEMAGEVERNVWPQSMPPQQIIKQAYENVRKRPGNKKQPANLRNTLEAAYDRAQARR